jgi:formate/nitrite transporter FocA (FNT family)
VTTAGDVLDREPEEIAEDAKSIGSQRLDRSNLDILVTSVIGGGELSFGALAATAVIGAVLATAPGVELSQALAFAGLVFPIGFIFVIMGRSELFTENFLIPVVSVFKTERTVGSLALLWSISWIGNMVGAAGISVMLLVPGVVDAPIQHGYVVYAAHKLDMGLASVFVSAMLAGGVMTTLTWSLISVQHTVARMAMICAAAYVLVAANLAHSIVSASMMFVGFMGTQYGLVDVVRWLLVATAGNVVGGVGLVTLFRLAQAHPKV